MFETIIKGKGDFEIIALKKAEDNSSAFSIIFLYIFSTFCIMMDILFFVAS